MPLPDDADGDGWADAFVTISDCPSSKPCSHETTQYRCAVGLYAKYSTVTYDDTSTCNNWEECQVRSDCGNECLSLSPAPTPAPTASPTNSVITDCSGNVLTEDDYRLTDWLGDYYCDETGVMLGGNFNCEKFDYDCCDCWDSDKMDDKECEPSSSWCNGDDDADRRRLLLSDHLMSTMKADEIEVSEPVSEPISLAVSSLSPESRQLNTKTLKTSSCFTCSSGKWCDEGSTTQSKCPRDSYCPNPSTKKPCPDNSICPPNHPTKTWPCTLGQYCPPVASEMIECPPGFFCTEPKALLLQGRRCEAESLRVLPELPGRDEGAPWHGDISSLRLPGIIAMILVIVLMELFVKRNTTLKKRAREEKVRHETRARAQSAMANDWQKLLAAVSTRNFDISHNVDDEEAAADKGFEGFVYLKPDPTPIGFEFQDLSLILKSGQRIIDHVSGKVEAGKMTAIMGPSGCGKTTMLNVLRNKASYGMIGGTLKVNETLTSIAPLQRIVGFVPQEDILHSELTVTEAITFSSLLRNNFKTPTQTRLKMVEEVIEVLGLEKCKNSVIGDQEIRGVSGGQRKRVSIAVELVTNPSICFLDEPTSGLDSTTSIELISMLKKMNHAGMTIVMVIHQPRYEIFEMIDDTLLLGQNGRPVYMGPGLKCLGYFTSIGFPCPHMKSPADHFLDVMSGTVPHDKDSSFTTAMLSDWWEASGSMSMHENPMLGGGGGRPPPIPVATIKKRKESKLLQNVSEGGAMSTFDVEDGGEKAAGGGKDLKEQAIAFFKKTTSMLLIEAVDWGKNAKQEAIAAAIAFKPSFTDKYRMPPSNPMQFGVCAWRSVRQIFAANKWTGFVSDCLMLIVVGAVLGSLFGVNNDWKEEARKLSLRNFTATLGIALTTCLRGLGTLGNERPAFWRERNSGVSCFSYFLGKITTDMIFITVFPAFFLFLFQAIAHPRGAFSDYYSVMFMTAWAASGQGYLLSMLFKPESAKFNGLLSCLLCMMFSGVEPTLKALDKGFVGKLLPLSFARWSCEALTVLEFKAYPEVYKTFIDQRILSRAGWQIANLDNCIEGLFYLGVFFRVVAFLLLKLSNRNKG